MRGTTLLTSAIALLVFAAAAGDACRGDPPVVIDRDAIADLHAGQTPDVGLDARPVPRVEAYGNSGCKEDLGGDPNVPCGEDEIVLTVDGSTLHVLHRNATYNCCPDDIVISLSVQGYLISLTEEEVLTTPCDCWCCYDVQATVVDLTPGTYTVEFCWFEYEMWDVRCCTDEIVIPGEPGPLGGDPPMSAMPGNVAPGGAFPSYPGPVPPLPRVESCSNSGCLAGSNGQPYWPCDEDEIELAVEANTLHVLHRNATYNCCPDDIVILLSVEGNVLRLTEEEFVETGCPCLCCYEVQATVVDLAPGTYVVEFCWYDNDTFAIECYVDEIVIPGNTGPIGGDPPARAKPGEVASGGDLQPSPDPSPAPPRVVQCSRSGCLDDPNDPWIPPCGGDEFEFVVEGQTLHVLHRNATYNCCLDDIVISVSLEGNVIALTEEEILTHGCWCICCFNVEATVVDLMPGEYIVEFCWFDYEAWDVRCHTAEIVIPGELGPLGGDPPVPVRPDGTVSGGLPPAPHDPSPAPSPRVDHYARSGCFDDPNDPWIPPCGGDEFEFVVEGHTLYVQHRNATYNCCLDDIVISVSLQGDVLALTEEEIVPDPCYCICCFNVEATIVDLPSGEYIVEFCWFDYETDQVECHVDQIVVP